MLLITFIEKLLLGLEREKKESEAEGQREVCTLRADTHGGDVHETVDNEAAILISDSETVSRFFLLQCLVILASRKAVASGHLPFGSA